MSGSKSGKAPTGTSSKKGIIIGIAILVAVIAVAAIAYNALAPIASNDGDKIVAAGTSANSSESSSGNVSKDAQANSSQSSSGDGSSDGERVDAPDFTVTDNDGKNVSLSQFIGKPIVLNFWASTCGPCQSEMPEFQTSFEKYGDQVQFMMVDIVGFNGETEKRAKQFISDNEYTFPVYFDTKDDVSVKYGLSSIPRTFIIDAEGYVVATASGMLDGESLQRGIDMVL